MARGPAGNSQQKRKAAPTSSNNGDPVSSRNKREAGSRRQSSTHDGSTSKSASMRSGPNSRGSSTTSFKTAPGVDKFSNVQTSRHQPLTLVSPPTAKTNEDGFAPASHICVQNEVGGQDETRKQDETVIISFIQKNVFPALKFVGMKQYHLEFSEKRDSICQIVVNGCNRGNHTDIEWWWRTTAKCVGKTVNRLRSDKVQSVKKEFNGKSVLLVQRVRHVID